MKLKDKVFLLVFFLNVSSVRMYAQILRPDYCICKAANTISDTSDLYKDSLYSSYYEDSLGINIRIYNTTKETLYIFNSYIQNHTVSSKYLHRIDKKNGLYKVSFLPLVPYLSTKYSDIISDNPVVANQQVVYDFFKLPPYSKQEVYLSYPDLFKNKNYKNNVMKDFDVKTLHKYAKKLPQKFYTTAKLNGKYTLQFEFAVYKNVNLVCNQSAYYLQEHHFDQQSKNFR